MRTIPETTAYLRDMIANESVSLMLIDVGELTALLDYIEQLEASAEDDRGVL